MTFGREFAADVWRDLPLAVRSLVARAQLAGAWVEFHPGPPVSPRRGVMVRALDGSLRYALAGFAPQYGGAAWMFYEAPARPRAPAALPLRGVAPTAARAGEGRT